MEKAVDVRCAAEGSDGSMYVGTDGAGLFARRSGESKWEHFGRADGLEAAQVYSLHVDRTGIVWIGMSGGGLGRYDGKRIFSFKTALEELPRSVTGLQTDNLRILVDRIDARDFSRGAGRN